MCLGEHTVWTVSDSPSKIALFQYSPYPFQNSHSANFVKSKIAPHLWGCFELNGGLLWIELGAILATPKLAPNSFQNSFSQPKNEGVFWISQNLQRGYIGKEGALFWLGSH